MVNFWEREKYILPPLLDDMKIMDISKDIENMD